MTPVAVGTIVAKNYLAQARVLADSLEEHHPGTRLNVLLIDEIGDCFDPAGEPFSVIPLCEVLPDPVRRKTLMFGYTCRAAGAAAKPLLFRHLLERGHERVAFLDPDMLVLGDLGALFESTGEIVLCPHRLGPRGDGLDAARSDLRLLLAGTFNGGVLAVRAGPVSDTFIRWWRARLERHCVWQVGVGIHYDQRWLDLVPGLFAGVQVLRDPGFNVAYWNLDERQPEKVRLFHYSGFDPTSPLVSIYAGDLRTEALSGFGRVFDDIRQRLLAAGYETASTWPYAFDTFDDGAPVPETMRDIYRSLGEGALRFGDPFAAGEPSGFRQWLATPVDTDTPAVSHGWMEIYGARVDLKLVYPDPLGADRREFANWVETCGRREYPQLP